MEQQKHLQPDLKSIPKTEPEDAGHAEGKDGTRKPKGIDFTLKPEELESYLNKYVVDQPEAVEVMATKICTHFNRMRYEIENNISHDQTLGNIKSNILMIGPTGVGKTFIIKLIADRIGVPFVKGDATKFSETGYVGGDVEDLVRELVKEADDNIELAEYGIVYIDEIDKIASSPGHWGPDVSRTGVQRNLLKLMEETEVDMKVPHDLASQMEAVVQAQRTGKAERKKVNTRNILFVVSGAFEGLEEIIQKRLSKRGMGFKSDVGLTPTEKANLFKNTTTRDLINYGFESEFIGRLPVTVTLNELNEESLFQILKNPNCAVIKAKKREFKSYGIELEFAGDALRVLAENAAKEETGARGLLSAVEKVLIRFEKKLPSTGIDKLVVNCQLIENPLEVLQDLTFNHSLEFYTEYFESETGIRLSFTDDAKAMITDKVADKESDTTAYLEKQLKDFIFGSKLMGIEELVVSVEILKDPQLVLDRMIKEAYDKKAQQ
ncbi:AAA family ATPase [bacterium]|nr:AAA family ATPase [bacterium]